MATIQKTEDIEIRQLATAVSKKYSELYDKNDTLIKKITAFINYLNASLIKGQKFKDRK